MSAGTIFLLVALFCGVMSCMTAKTHVQRLLSSAVVTWMVWSLIHFNGHG